MRNLNSTNGADILLLDIAKKCLDEFEDHLYGAEFGIAWGGGVESIGKIWRNRGTILGLDTFEGHPKHLAPKGSFEGNCMDGWYNEFGYEELTLEYQQKQLDDQGLTNVILKKGLIDSNTDVSYITHLNYVLLDLDIPKCMDDAYNLIKDKIRKCGHLCLHDVVPDGHIGGLNTWYKKILANDGYELIGEYPESYLAILKKTKNAWE